MEASTQEVARWSRFHSKTGQKGEVVNNTSSGAGMPGFQHRLHRRPTNSVRRLHKFTYVSEPQSFSIISTYLLGIVERIKTAN